MSFEYQLLNVLGFSFYTVYSWLLAFDRDVRRKYKDAFGSESLVTVQDACFSLWAATATAVTLVQIGLYDDGGKCHRIVLAAVAAVTVTTFIYAIICATTPPGPPVVSGVSIFSWLAWLYWLSAVKLGVTLSKYWPQAVLNYQRKSTVGWSIANVLLDFTGGTLSIAQLLLDGATLGWTGVIGDPIKFALGFVSILFDILFMLQHYVFYPEPRRSKHHLDFGPPPPPRSLRWGSSIISGTGGDLLLHHHGHHHHHHRPGDTDSLSSRAHLLPVIEEDSDDASSSFPTSSSSTTTTGSEVSGGPRYLS